MLQKSLELLLNGSKLVAVQFRTTRKILTHYKK
jgi:hypothetical protein